MGPAGPTARPWRNTSEGLRQANWLLAVADGAELRQMGCSPFRLRVYEGGEGWPARQAGLPATLAHLA
jgi:hypothetical protein